jgi:hypothetical protein
MLALLAAGACARAPARPPAPPPAATALEPASAGTVAPSHAAAAAPHGEGPGGAAPEERAAEPGTGSVASSPPAATPDLVREAVSGVASSPARPARAAPQALQAIAGLLERVAGGSAPAAEATGRMRASAEALSQLDAIDLARADRVKEALAHGVEALRAVARSRRAGFLEPWVDAAAAAGNAIDPATPLGLQLAAVQDALRSLADAVLVAEQFGR